MNFIIGMHTATVYMLDYGCLIFSSNTFHASRVLACTRHVKYFIAWQELLIL